MISVSICTALTNLVCSNFMDPHHIGYASSLQELCAVLELQKIAEKCIVHIEKRMNDFPGIGATCCACS